MRRLTHKSHRLIGWIIIAVTVFLVTFVMQMAVADRDRLPDVLNLLGIEPSVAGEVEASGCENVTRDNEMECSA